MGVPEKGIGVLWPWAAAGKAAHRRSAKAPVLIATAADLKAERMERIPNSPPARQNGREFRESDLTT